MIALLEPLFSKSKFDPIHIVLGIVVLIGIYILAPEFDLESSQLQGILFGLFSALCYALRILILKQEVSKYNGTMLMFYQVYFKASTASIIGSTQPIFGIIIAYFFLNEIPTIHTFVGGALILATVVIESVRSKNR